MVDFYCDEILSGKVEIKKVQETDRVLAYHHTRPHYSVHIVVIPKQHFDSLLSIGEKDTSLLKELTSVIQKVAADIVKQHGACRVLTNLGSYQDTKHLHWHLVFDKTS